MESNKNQIEISQNSYKNEEKEETVKILLIGDQAVGKSSLMFRYTDDTFNEFLTGTAGIDLKKKSLVINNTPYKILIYDTAGHERYRQFAKNQMKTMNGIVIVYDITDRKSFENINIWLKSINEITLHNTSIIIVGNKTDLNFRQVSVEEATKLSELNNLSYYETSAFNGNGINEAFDLIISKSINKITQKKHESNQAPDTRNKIVLSNTEDKKQAKVKFEDKKKSKCVCG